MKRGAFRSDTFGYLLSEHRIQRGWTEQQLASAIPSTTEALVVAWEAHTAVPNASQLDQLVNILITTNESIPPGERQQAEENFRNHAAEAERILAKIANGEFAIADVSSLTSFGKKIGEYRRQAGLSETMLADKLAVLNASDIRDIQHGKQPSEPERKALLAGLEALGVLSGEEKEALASSTRIFSTRIMEEKTPSKGSEKEELSEDILNQLKATPWHQNKLLRGTMSRKYASSLLDKQGTVAGNRLIGAAANLLQALDIYSVKALEENENISEASGLTAGSIRVMVAHVFDGNHSITPAIAEALTTFYTQASDRSHEDAALFKQQIADFNEAFVAHKAAVPQRRVNQP